MLVRCSLKYFSSLDPLASLCSALPSLAKKAFSGQIRLLLSGQHACSGFQAREGSCTPQGTESIGRCGGSFALYPGKVLIGTKARVASRSNPALGLVVVL